MRFVFLSLDFGLLLLTIIALSQSQGTNAHPEELCRPANCMAANKCESLPTRSLKCQNPKDTCCSLVKMEYRTLCEHWGGSCMDKCHERLTQKSTDCASPQVCCVLVR